MSLVWAALIVLLAVWAVWRAAPRQLAGVLRPQARRQPDHGGSLASRLVKKSYDLVNVDLLTPHLDNPRSRGRPRQAKR